MTPRGIVVSLKQAAFFPSGTDVVDPATMPTIEKVAGALKAVENPIRIEGHTDSIPIHNPRFRSNWDLSAARSIAIMFVLSSRFDISPQRMSIAGYADTVPVADNDTPEGRARNRRVDLVILNNYALAKTEPAKSDVAKTSRRRLRRLRKNSHRITSSRSNRLVRGMAAWACIAACWLSCSWVSSVAASATFVSRSLLRAVCDCNWNFCAKSSALVIRFWTAP